VSTSGLAPSGLGWPASGSDDPDADESTGLGWPNGAPAPTSHSSQGGSLSSEDDVSRETAAPPAEQGSAPAAGELPESAQAEHADAVAEAALSETAGFSSDGSPLGATPDAVSRETASVPDEPTGPSLQTAPSALTALTGSTVTGVPRETTQGRPGPDGTSARTQDELERTALAAELPATDDDTPLAREVAVDARRRISLSGKVFPKPDNTRVLTVANQKGGVGKTTTTVNVAAALAQAGLRVLVIDIDPQGNASTALGIDHHAEVSSIYDVLVDGMDIAEVVQECPDIPNLWCAPATIDLAGAEIELVSLVARETRMQRALRRYIDSAAARGEERLDYVLIDCPPSLGLLTVNAFVAAEEVFIPIQCEYYALEGLSQLLKNIELIKNHLNPDLHVSTILLTMYDGRTRLSAQVADDVRTHFPDQVLRTTVPRSVRISEAPSHGQTVMTYDPSSSGALSYLEAAGELADRGVLAP